MPASGYEWSIIDCNNDSFLGICRLRVASGRIVILTLCVCHCHGDSWDTEEHLGQDIPGQEYSGGLD